MKEAGHRCGVNEYNYLLKAEFLCNDMGGEVAVLCMV
jgi:hypothetical protein